MFQWLAIGPRIHPTPTGVEAFTSRWVQALSLGSYRRHVEVDTVSRYVHLERRLLWGLVRRRTIPFRHVDHVSYDFDRLVTGMTWEAGGNATRSTVTDQWEAFRVGLVLDEARRAECVPLFTFRGAGAVSTGLAGVLYGDSAVDAKGTQEHDSRVFARTIASLLDVPLGAPTRIPVA